jgi:hypothetical protein
MQTAAISHLIIQQNNDESPQKHKDKLNTTMIALDTQSPSQNSAALHIYYSVHLGPITLTIRKWSIEQQGMKFDQPTAFKLHITSLTDWNSAQHENPPHLMHTNKEKCHLNIFIRTENFSILTIKST